MAYLPISYPKSNSSLMISIPTRRCKPSGTAPTNASPSKWCCQIWSSTFTSGKFASAPAK